MRRRPAVHLRARGEHCRSGWRRGFNGGSSPRTRRTQPDNSPKCRPKRFISAHAENTRAGLTLLDPRAVHLRARGEHTLAHLVAFRRGGSSPRTRRTHTRAQSSRRRRRFISAHAENTFTRRRSGSPNAVHLRARGEHVSRFRQFLAPAGSSPRTRRTPGSRCRSRARHRFISAHAENTNAGF